MIFQFLENIYLRWKEWKDKPTYLFIQQSHLTWFNYQENKHQCQ